MPLEALAAETAVTAVRATRTCWNCIVKCVVSKKKKLRWRHPVIFISELLIGAGRENFSESNEKKKVNVP